jgi:type IV pilus assembly protein PilW
MTRFLLRRARGFSLVELMVSVVIGMLALLFATRLVISGEANKDAAVGGSDAMQNGMLALFSLSGDASAAGWGLNDGSVAGCNTTFADSNGYQLLTAKRDGVDVTPLAGVVIQSNGANPDVISFNSGSSQAGVGSVKMIANYTGGPVITVESNNPYGFNNGDVLVVAASTLGPPCTLIQMSGFNPAAGQWNQMLVNAGNAYRFNPTSGMAQSYLQNATFVYNLGQPNLLHFHTWSVRNGILLLRATELQGASAAPVSVVDNVVSIKAQYGFDTRVGAAYSASPAGNSKIKAAVQNGAPVGTTGMQVGQWSSTIINADSDAETGGPGDYQRIAAVRIAVVARSKTAEKPGTDGKCTATTALPQVFTAAAPSNVPAVPIEVNVAVAGDPQDWRCYRYRVFETIVPLLNAQFIP